MLKAEDAQTPSFTYLFLMCTGGWDAGTPSLSSLSALRECWHMYSPSVCSDS